jgi:hypothetical protein
MKVRKLSVAYEHDRKQHSQSPRLQIDGNCEHQPHHRNPMVQVASAMFFASVLMTSTELIEIVFDDVFFHHH